MSSDLWRDADRILADVLDLPEPDRRAVLQSACAGRPALAAEIESLLAEEGRRGPLDAIDAAAAGVDERGHASLAGRRVGPYRLVNEIGRGGMGSVWLAERDDQQFHKRVAVKLIAGGLPAFEALRRFREERQILASLEHPHIAHLLDAGRSDDGLHYIVMEYVEGVPLCEYCETSKLDVRGRVELLRTIASTVHFAHQRLVVHRDLKPANILVTADGGPKLLDFGVAKMLSPTDRGPTSTAPLFNVITPAYASPEQLRGAPATTSSDVYSLGVLSYELLAGCHPYRSTASSPEDLFAAVCEQDPEKPSAAAMRATDRASARRVASALSGDIDAIVLKAMRKAPHERYTSAEELAEDLDRHLRSQPVRARRGTMAYRSRKFAARHLPWVVAGIVACVLGAAGIAGVVWQAGVARRSRATAERRFNDVRQLAGAMIFDLDRQIALLPGSTSARRALVTRATEYLDRLARETADDTTLAIELANGFARVGEVQGNPSQSNLGDSAGALRSYASARQILGPVLARDPLNHEARRLLARLHLLTGDVLIYLRRPAEAKASIEEALRLRTALASTGTEQDRRDLAGAYFRMADATDDPVEELALRRRALETFEALLAAHPDDPEAQRNVALSYKTISSTLDVLKQRDQAKAANLKALAIDERRVAADPSSRLARLDLSFDTSQMATYLSNEGDSTGALAYFRRTIEIRRSLVDADPNDARARGRLAYAYMKSGRLRRLSKDHRGAIEDLTAAQALSARLVSSNADDSTSRAYLAEASANIGYSEHALASARAMDGVERNARRLRACAAFTRALDAYRINESRGTASDGERRDATLVEQQLAACR